MMQHKWYQQNQPALQRQAIPDKLLPYFTSMCDHHHTHVNSRTDCDFVNLLPQLEQTYAAYLKDISKLEELEAAFKAATNAGCAETTVYKKVGALLLTRPESDFANILPQLERAFAAYLKDTTKLEELERAFKTVTDTGFFRDTTVYNNVGALLQAIKTVITYLSMIAAMISAIITILTFTRAPTLA